MLKRLNGVIFQVFAGVIIHQVIFGSSEWEEEEEFRSNQEEAGLIYSSP